MARGPCCEKMGLKKGPWSLEEDQILINFINLYGHGNWRALPKQAGLLRCGKSCRLRWTNYLRPDIKRGNFTVEEEDTIIKLHGMLGNRWSAIAARLPGRTDNEIKNVWHTHLKKRVTNHIKNKPNKKSDRTMNFIAEHRSDSPIFQQNSPPHSSSEISSITSAANFDENKTDVYLPERDSNFWSDVFPEENSSKMIDFPGVNGDLQLNFPFSPLHHSTEYAVGLNCTSSVHDGMDFWYNLFMGAGELSEF